METKEWKRDAQMLRFCVDKVTAAVMEGRVLNMRLSEPVPFADLGDMLLRVDEILDLQGFPQAFQRARAFSQRAEPVALAQDEGMSAESVQKASGAVLTFDVLVVTRKNSTWQGVLDWLDGQDVQPFSSALELIRMIDRHTTKA